MLGFRDLLIQTRIHTAALTIPGVLLGAYLADPTQDAFRFLNFGILALLCHASGFLVNGLLDLPWDHIDPSKQHFPLVRGTITERQGWILALFLSYIAFALGTILANGNRIAILFLLLFALAGTAYNALAKISLSGPLFISASFAALPLYAWTASNGPLNHPVALYLGGYSFLLMLGQIAVSGYVKELAQTSEVNLLRRLGATAKKFPWSEDLYQYEIVATAYYVSFLFRYPLLLAGVAFATMYQGSLTPPLFAILGLFFAILGLFAWHAVISSGQWFRSKKVFWMGIAEISAYWLLVTSLTGYLGTMLAIAFCILPVLWYAILNKIMWGQASAPRV